MTNFQKEVLNLLNQGFTISQISRLTNHPMSSVSSVIKRFAVTNYEKAYINSVYHEFFDRIDTEHKAYFLGFLIADGTLSNNKRANGRIGFLVQEGDKYVLEVLKKDISSTNSIYIRCNLQGAKCRKPQASFRWTSQHMLNTLITEYNIVPNKTLNTNFTFPLNKIPTVFLGAFVRGFIDGDGSFESHLGAFTPSIVGTSVNWLKQIGDIVTEITGLTYTIYTAQGKTCTYYTLRWSANRDAKFNKVLKLYDFLYKDATIYLKRKLEKIEAYLEYRAKQLGVTSPVSVTHRD